jgi:peroxiredoxin Q/BCP
LGAVLAGVSTDTVERHQQFRTLNNLPFPLVADPTKQIAKLYDVRRRFGLGTSRVTYVIDREGVIRGVFHNELDMASHVRAVLATLRKLQE